MTRHIVIDVGTISPRFSTRERGEEAYKKLAPVLVKGHQVVLDLDSIDSVSPSFLDGLLLRLNEHGQSVSFRTKRPRVKGRLRRIAFLRHVPIKLCDHQGRVESITP